MRSCMSVICDRPIRLFVKVYMSPCIPKSTKGVSHWLRGRSKKPLAKFLTDVMMSDVMTLYRFGYWRLVGSVGRHGFSTWRWLQNLKAWINVSPHLILIPSTVCHVAWAGICLLCQQRLLITLLAGTLRHFQIHFLCRWRSWRNIYTRLQHIPLGPHGIVCLTPYFSLYVRYITSDYCLYSMSGIFLLTFCVRYTVLLLTIACMSGIFLLTFCVRYITSDYLDLLGLSSLFSLPGDPLVRILNSETYICEQKPVYVIRPVLSRISCVLYIIPTPPWICNRTTIFILYF